MNEKVKHAICNLDMIIAEFMLAVLVFLTLVGVVMRYFLNAPLSWLEEVQLFCQVWIVFCGGIGAFRLGGHVAIEFVAEALPEKGQKILLVINTVIITVILGYLAVQCWSYLQMFISSKRTTAILHISYVLMDGVAPVSLILMIVNNLMTLKEKWVEIETRCSKRQRISENKGGIA